VNPKPILIGNAQGFWGDSVDAPARLVSQQPDLDYLTLDYLAEVSMSILASQRARDATAGYARDFIEVVRSLIPFWEKGSKVRVISNAGGLNPRGCAKACVSPLPARSFPLEGALVAGNVNVTMTGNMNLRTDLSPSSPFEIDPAKQALPQAFHQRLPWSNRAAD